MSRRRLKSLEDYSRALKAGYGLGKGSDYRPWLRVRDISSKGKSAKPFGIKTCRVHQFLSSLEENFFYFAEFIPAIIDIREQFPLLPIDLVMRLCREIGIQYPLDKDTKEPVVLSTDFLLTKQIDNELSFIAFSVKESEDLEDEGTLIRQEIERVWWNLLGASWFLVTEKQLNRVMANNLKWISNPLRGSKPADVLDADDGFIQSISTMVKPGIYTWAGLVEDIALALDKSPKKIAEGFKAAIWLKYVEVDLTMPIQEHGLVHVVRTFIEKGDANDRVAS